MKEMMEFFSQMMEGCDPEFCSQMMNRCIEFMKSRTERASESGEDAIREPVKTIFQRYEIALLLEVWSRK